MIPCPRPLPFSHLTVGGELAMRARRNFDRLEEEQYRPAKVFQAPGYEWPGDTEGRAILALSLLAQATHREPKYLAEIINGIPSHVNARGYFGAISPDGVMNEQQLASHGWVLRGLCEEFLRTKSKTIESMIHDIVRTLVLPTAGYHLAYPIDPVARTHSGSHAGHTFSLLDGWELSSDIGCDFIFLDGVVQAWEITGGDVLKAVIDEIVHRFLEVDLVAIKAQTHATLTCLRAILRYAVAADLPTLIPEVETRYCLYRERAWTEDFANYNWFERPEWTEPCAIVDSFMVAVGLWQVTGQAEYLADAHLIYFNALGHAQRSNGGFGCDTCVGAAGPFIQISIPEAFWCCTMRGGEGLARAIEYSYFTEEDKIFVPFFHESEAALATGGGRVHLRQSTSYPLQGRARLDVLEQTGKALRLRLFRPPWAAQPTVMINGRPRQVVEQRGFIEIDEPLNAGDVIEYQFDLLLQEAATVNRFSVAGYGSLRHGPLLLACESSSEVSVKEVPKTVSPDAHYRLPDGTVLAPINDAIAREQMDKETYRRQVLFKRS